MTTMCRRASATVVASSSFLVSFANWCASGPGDECPSAVANWRLSWAHSCSVDDIVGTSASSVERWTVTGRTDVVCSTSGLLLVGHLAISGICSRHPMLVLCP
jgi:hypothetical protein